MRTFYQHATYAGHCLRCPEPINPGDEIVRTRQGAWLHARCASGQDDD